MFIKMSLLTLSKAVQYRGAVDRLIAVKEGDYVHLSGTGFDLLPLFQPILKQRKDY